jgi:hypothetical protein
MFAPMGGLNAHPGQNYRMNHAPSSALIPQIYSYIAGHHQRHNPKAIRFLKNAHRVGMRAMNTMSMRSSEDTRSFTKLSKVFSERHFT